ncbi:glutathione transferase GstA [Sneathiella marina]|uniref:Glutathione transferase GstA n=1 Tax=Sneathiella marina TaxID=2950108 RepID=A0ABY4W4B2_9PROT|nr:glutathione transferase GstA [Sneathiella marina]USG62037.1 glutathione transferase GstA [Sneathiella marina]
MKLFYKPGACSLATHIILHEVGATFELDEVDTEAGQTKSDLDYKKINPKGYVPALELVSGEILTEGASILQYIADQNPQSGLTPAAETIARARLQEYLNYTGSELHKAFGPYFSNSASNEDKEEAGLNVAKKFDYLNGLLSDGRTYLLGDKFSVADAYLFVVSNWSNFVGIDLKKWPNVAVFVERVAKRPATQAAMTAEGLL